MVSGQEINRNNGCQFLKAVGYQVGDIDVDSLSVVIDVAQYKKDETFRRF